MASLLIPFPAGCFVWLPWRSVWYLARVEETREAERGDVELLIHVQGEPFTKNKWMTVHRDGSTAAGTPPLQLLKVLPTALTGIGSLLAIIASRRTDDEDPSTVQVPTLVGIVVKVLAAGDSSLVDVAYPTEIAGQASDEAQWQRVQICNGYINVISETRFALGAASLDPPEK